MKKTLLGILAVASITLASCGEKLLTEQEVAAEITKGIEAGKAAIVTEEEAACTSTFDARVEARVAELKAADEAATATEAMPTK